MKKGKKSKRKNESGEKIGKKKWKIEKSEKEKKIKSDVKFPAFLIDGFSY